MWHTRFCHKSGKCRDYKPFHAVKLCVFFGVGGGGAILAKISWEGAEKHIIGWGPQQLYQFSPSELFQCRTQQIQGVQQAQAGS